MTYADALSWLAIGGGLVLCACAVYDMARTLGPTHDRVSDPYRLERAA